MLNINSNNNDLHSKQTQKGHVVLLNLWRVINAKGGTEKVFCNMANALSRLGYRVTAICHDDHIGLPSFPIENINFINAFKPHNTFISKTLIKFRSLHIHSQIRKNKRNLLISKEKCDNIINSISNWDQVDLIIAFQPEAAYFVRDLMHLDIPLFTMYHSTPETFDKKTDFDERNKNSASKSNVVQVLMPEYIKIARRMHPHTPIICIPNTAPQYESPSKLTSHTIINIARLSNEKRPDLFVKSFALLKDRYPDWKCEWWGEYHLNPTLKRHIQDLIHKFHLEDRFLLKGQTDDVESKLRESSIFAFPSSYEGQSLAMLEAMSMGLPVVGCLDCPSVNTLIRDRDNGLLTHPTPESYSLALAKLMDNEKLRYQLGTKAREDMKEYSPECIWKKWDNLIQSLINYPKISEIRSV